MTRASRPQTARTLLARGQFGVLVRTLDQHLQLLQRLRTLLPPELAKRVSHARQERGSIIIHCDTPIDSTRLRFMLPQLLNQLGLASQRLQVRVRPVDIRPARTAPKQQPLSSKTVRDTLAAVDDPQLRAALERIGQSLQQREQN